MAARGARAQVAFGASKRAWMGRRINLLKQLRVGHVGLREVPPPFNLRPKEEPKEEL